MPSPTLLFLTIVIGAVLIAAYWPEYAKSVFNHYRSVREVVLPVVIVVFGWVLLDTGSWMAILLGAFMLVVLVWTIYFDYDGMPF